jgi:hypothetical protein
MSNINMPFGPWVPDDQIVPAVIPGNDKKAQTVVIKQVHAVVLHPRRDTFGCVGPTCEHVPGICITQDHCEQRFTRTVSGCGHLV